jgi:succinate dehydrogenase/fumarate reductase flavoprotein subunit
LAAEYAGAAELLSVSEEQIATTDARFTASAKSKGSLGVMDMVAEIQKVMQPLGNSLYRHEDRMKAALGRVEELEALLPQIKADDPHQMFGANECSAMLLCSEMFFKASLERKESLGWFLREDYPEPSKEGLHWVIVKNEDGKVALGKERVPLETYPYQP